MKVLVTFAMILQIITPGWTQSNWAPSGIPFECAQIRCLHYDAISDVLWVGGDIRDQVPNNQVLLKYDGSNWKSYGHFDNQILEIALFEDKLIVGGFFSSYNHTPCSHLAYLEGDEFVEFGGGTDGVITMLQVLGDTLYAGGNFDTIGNLETNMIAKYDGQNWLPIEEFPEVGDGDVASTILQFGDQLFVGGNYGPLWSDADIYYLNNGSWASAGGGILGGISDVRDMVIYIDELIIGGAIDQSAGNAGHSIQKWNDPVWEELGGSLTGVNFSNSQFTPVNDLDVYNGKLYIAGYFENAGDIYSPYYTVWDGEKYGAFGGTFTGYGGGGELEFFHDTLYVACRDSVDGQFVNNLAKYVGSWGLENCSTVEIQELVNMDELYLFPNPADSELHIKSNSTMSYIEIRDLSGRGVLSTVPYTTQTKLVIEPLASGCYLLTATFINGSISTTKFFKR